MRKQANTDVRKKNKIRLVILYPFFLKLDRSFPVELLSINISANGADDKIESKIY